MDAFKLSKSTQTDRNSIATQTDELSTSAHGVDAKIYVFEIRLKHGYKVPIWRTIEVSAAYSFYDLHVAIQDSMGWSDSHLHEFKMKNPAKGRTVHIGIPDSYSYMDKPVKPEKYTPIANYFTLSNRICKYEYDFGSPWSFLVTLKSILDKDPNASYPRCVAGNCISPPEELLEDPFDMSWIKPLILTDIIFRDPVEAWKDAFQGF